MQTGQWTFLPHHDTVPQGERFVFMNPRTNLDPHTVTHGHDRRPCPKDRIERRGRERLMLTAAMRAGGVTAHGRDEER